MAKKRWTLIYGANGYTGKLCVAEARRRSIPFVLGGRNKSALEELADSRERVVAFGLRNPSEIEAALADVDCILNCAGPFVHTAKPIIDACLKTKTNYLDITGEISVFEDIFTYDNAAKEAGVSLIPGVGFDVVPTDCIAAMLHEHLPDATNLQLCFRSTLGPSRGTATTGLAHASEGSYIRKNGKLHQVKGSPEVIDVEFPSGQMQAAAIPWGDISTAYRSTGIPNIKCFVGLPKAQLKAFRRLRYITPLLRIGFVRDYAQKKIEARGPGPSDDKRARSKSEVVGMVMNSNRERRTANAVLPDGYTFTAIAAMEAARRATSHTNLPRGALTPSLAFGHRFLEELEGVTVSTPWSRVKARA